MRYALEFFAPIPAGPTRQADHLMAKQLQERLGRLDDLSAAKQLLAELSPGAKGQVLQASLLAQSEALLPDLGQVLQDFRVRRRPGRPLVTILGRRASHERRSPGEAIAGAITGSMLTSC